MIPVIWLKYAKYAAPVALILLVFFGGWYTKGRLVEAKIERMEQVVSTLTNNYNRAVEIIDTCQENFDALEAALGDQNAAIEKLRIDSDRRVARAEEMRRIALANAARTHENAMSELQEDYARLHEEWALLTASESCHEAWVEVTK